MNKNELRKKMKGLRRAVTREEKKLMSGAIYDTLFRLEPFLRARTVCSYLSAFNEPDTIRIIKELWFRGCAVAVPITHTDTELLSLSYLNAIKDLSEGAYKIKKPTIIKEALISEMDAILVPGLAFDRGGNRLGFGKGCYDKLLAGSRVLKIGLCYGFQITDAVPAEKHDVKMDYIITEKETIRTDIRYAF